MEVRAKVRKEAGGFRKTISHTNGLLFIHVRHVTQTIQIDLRTRLFIRGISTINIPCGHTRIYLHQPLHEKKIGHG